jgi:Flp pilus assembly protein TadB
MSLLLHIIVKLIAFVVLGIVILTLMTWLSKAKREQTRPPSLGELPEDKAAHLNRISARPYSSSRRDLKDEQERRRA